ncbi:MAG TPA: hypothetical protein VHM19_17950 [Polyangiales bacterium]|jgi:hypothetical protein|nr:hypothetical protein [Polyangiales bacterium]
MTDGTWKFLVAFIVVATLLAVRYIITHQTAMESASHGSRGMVPPDPRSGLYPDKPGLDGTDDPQKAPLPQAPVKIASATEITCKQGSLTDCNKAARKLAEAWEIEDNRKEAERWFSYTCQHGSRDGCRSLLVLAKTYGASQEPGAAEKERTLLYRTCEMGDPKACDEAMNKSLSAAMHGDNTEKNVDDAHDFLGRLCHAGFQDKANLCSSERDRFKELLGKGIKGLPKPKVKAILKEMADQDKRGNFMTPNEARRDWADP